MPLHITHRPTKLEQVIGNRETVSALEAILNRKSDFPHALLFTGPSGTGKTTLARIVAARLGIADADLCELNIANLRGIDNARDIQERMRLRPLSGSARGWILDEVGASTKDFQQAMLKTLEDTPDHVYFFLCTTDPQKLLPTIKTRCHEFKTEALGTKRLMELLCSVAEAEHVDVPTDVLAQICQDANGSARAALVVLDSIIDMQPADMLAAAARKAADQNESISLCRALMDGRTKWTDAAKILAGLQEQEPESVRQAVLGYANAVLLKVDNPKAFLVIDVFKEPFYNSGRAGLTCACYEVVNSK